MSNVPLPEPVQRLMRFAGKKRNEVSNPCLTAREAIVIADHIAHAAAVSAAENARLREQLTLAESVRAAQVAGLTDGAEKLQRDAARWQKLRSMVRGERHTGTGHNQGFAFPSRFELPPLGDIMRGSVAQHLDAAIDAAMEHHGS